MMTKSISDLAREAGFPERRAFSDLSDLYPRLERFHDLAIAQYRESLLAGCEGAVYVIGETEMRFAHDLLTKAKEESDVLPGNIYPAKGGRKSPGTEWWPMKDFDMDLLTDKEIETLLDGAGYLADGKWVTDVPKALVQSVIDAVLEKVGKVAVEPVAYMNSDGRVIHAQGKKARLLNTPGDQQSGIKIYDPYPTHDVPLYPASALAALRAENERLAGEVSNRNRRAIEGDEAVAALNKVHDYYEQEVAALRAQLGQAQADLALREAEVSSLQIDKEQAQADAARMREALEKAAEQLRCNIDNMNKGMSKSIQKLCARENKDAIDAARAALGDK